VRAGVRASKHRAPARPRMKVCLALHLGVRAHERATAGRPSVSCPRCCCGASARLACRCSGQLDDTTPAGLAGPRLRDQVVGCADCEPLLAHVRRWLHEHWLLIVHDRALRTLVTSASRPGRRRTRGKAKAKQSQWADGAPSWAPAAGRAPPASNAPAVYSAYEVPNTVSSTAVPAAMSVSTSRGLEVVGRRRPYC
jgi:hypothetical protein